jgi:putative addiction module component (TIGR02574 family)
MRSAPEQLEDDAMRLPPRSRARLAQRLIASLEQEPADPDAEALWMTEAQRRAEELASGKVHGIPAETALTKARAALR